MATDMRLVEEDARGRACPVLLASGTIWMVVVDLEGVGGPLLGSAGHCHVPLGATWVNGKERRKAGNPGSED